MKGKGEKGKSTNISSSLLVEDVQESFATIKTFDHTKHCPKYTSILSDKACEYPDLEQLESDLQMMLASTLRRIKNLNTEMQGLNAWQEKTRVSSSPSVSEHSGQKRGSKGKLGEERPLKRVRTDSGRATYAVYNKGKGKDQHDSSEQQQHQTIKAPKNVTPSRFWAMVDSYCGEITQDDVAFLEEQLKVYADVAEYMKVPALGRHYAEQWNEEDASMEEREANKLNKRYNVTSSSKLPQQHNNNNNSTDQFYGLKKTESSDSDCPYGDLAQRLVQGLVEEEVMLPLHDDLSMPPDAELSEMAHLSSAELAERLNICNSDLLEVRLKKELVSLGIFDEKDDDTKKDKDADKPESTSADHLNISSHTSTSTGDEEGKDEVLRELRRKQMELKALSAQNVETLKGLLKCAREEVVRGRLKKRLHALDAEVTEAYKKYQALKAKRKSPSKKDSESFFRLLNDRKLILKELNERDA